jgi:predicted nucleotidyltransferase
MAKIPKTPEEIFAEITEDYRRIFGGGLVSLILFGSAAGPDYIPGRSDLNFLVILDEAEMDGLERTFAVVKRWKKRRVATPLFMTKAYIASSLDVYPVEFLNMKERHRLVYGEDVLDGLAFDTEHVRLQLERELKGKILHLRQHYVETEGRTRAVRELIGISMTAMLSLFLALLFLKRRPIPSGRREVVRDVSAQFSLPADVFLTALEIRAGTDRLSDRDVQAFFPRYVNAIQGLCTQIDQWRT